MSPNCGDRPGGSLERKKSPKGRFTFKRTNETAEQKIKKFMAEVEEWARNELGDWERDMAAEALRKVAGLRVALDIAASKGDETKMQSVWCVWRMMDLCHTAYAGRSMRMVEAGIGAIEGGKKGGENSRKRTPEMEDEIRRIKAATPRGQWKQKKPVLVKRFGIKPRTIERIK
jgi:hypothetical protein